MHRPATRSHRRPVAVSHRRAIGLLAVLAVAGVLAACGASSSADGVLDGPVGEHAGPGAATAEELTGTLTVLAAASLTETFGDLGRRFEELHPALEVRFSFGGSATLAQQVLAGAPADVLATADHRTMELVTAAGAHAADPALLAHNAIQVAVPPDNPANITTPADLTRPDVTFAMCAPEVPCGAAAEALLAAAGATTAGITATPVTYERDVRAVLTKVRLGEVDAGLVYRTDIAAAGGDVVGIPTDHPTSGHPTPDHLHTAYVIAPLAEAPNPDAAEAFVAFALGTDGREALRAAGFGVP